MSSDAPTPSTDLRLELRDMLERILRKITGQLWSNPRQTQLDVGSAINLVLRVDLPNREYLAMQLSHMVRDLGARHPNTSHYVGMLENSVTLLDQLVERDRGPAA